nr:hypothetical protein [Bradyrhizobium forestalis]
MQVQDRVHGDDDGVERPPAEIEIAHVQLDESRFNRIRSGMIPRTLEHRARQIGSDDLKPGLRQRNGQATAAACKIENAAASLARRLDIEAFEDRISRRHQVVEIWAIVEAVLFHEGDGSG